MHHDQAVIAGSAEIHAIEEMRVKFKVEALFGDGATSDAVLGELDCVDPASVDPTTGELVLSVQSFLVETPDKNILIDTCCGNGRTRSVALWSHMLNTPYLDRLNAAGVSPEEIDAVICTHLHVDHVGWNVRQEQGAWRRTFPNATYIFGAEEYAWWKREHETGGPGSAPYQREAFYECVQPIIDWDAATLVPADFRLDELRGVEIWLEPLPGHTPHQSGVHLRSGGKHVFFLADAMHHAVQFRKPGWVGRNDADRRQSNKTINQLIDRYADTSTILLLGHAARLSEYRLVSTNGGLRLAPPTSA